MDQTAMRGLVTNSVLYPSGGHSIYERALKRVMCCVSIGWPSISGMLPVSLVLKRLLCLKSPHKVFFIICKRFVCIKRHFDTDKGCIVIYQAACATAGCCVMSAQTKPTNSRAMATRATLRHLPFMTSAQ